MSDITAAQVIKEMDAIVARNDDRRTTDITMTGDEYCALRDGLVGVRDFDIDAYLASLPWSEGADNMLVTYVNGNVRSALYRLKKMAGWTDDTQVTA